uniref:Uncharacterized protein n=1 Tax=Arundo donax TaxID=35708 RepID=A0A0A9C1Y5_ARUDO
MCTHNSSICTGHSVSMMLLTIAELSNDICVASQ